MPLTAQQITACKSDEELFALLSSELGRQLSHIHSDDDLVAAMQMLPAGLRAMASIHRLDISLATDDLGWHFYNFHHQELCDETQRGLRELEAHEAAEIFEAARALVEPHWEKISEIKKTGPAAFTGWYQPSGIESAMSPLNDRLWRICAASPEYGLMQCWLDYTRKFPERVAG